MRLIHASTSWTGVFLVLEPATCIMYQEQIESITIVQTGGLWGLGTRADTMRTNEIDGVDLQHGWAGNTLTVRTKPGDTRIIPRLKKKASTKIYRALRQCVENSQSGLDRQAGGTCDRKPAQTRPRWNRETRE